MLHILNLCTPLSPPRFGTSTLGVRKVDITGTAIRSILTSLTEAEKITNIDSETEHELLVKKDLAPRPCPCRPAPGPDSLDARRQLLIAHHLGYRRELHIELDTPRRRPRTFEVDRHGPRHQHQS